MKIIEFIIKWLKKGKYKKKRYKPPLTPLKVS
jgi:hypothetical protein